MSRQTLIDNANYALPAYSRAASGKLVSESCERMVELHRRNPALTTVLISKLWRIQQVCVCPYVREIALCILSDLKVPGPEEIARRYGISKQAISKATLDAVEKLWRVDRSLAMNLRRYAQEAIKGPEVVLVEKPEDALPEIDSVGLAHVREPWQLEDYLEGMAVRIIAKRHDTDDDMELANRVRAALSIAAKTFLRHTASTHFKGYTAERSTEEIVDRLIYSGEAHTDGVLTDEDAPDDDAE